jgi:AAA+ superfamily predicted ATPase
MITFRMDWNEAAEELLDQILKTTPLPVREQIAAKVRQTAESMAEGDGKSRVGTNTVVHAWIESTPEALRAEMPRQMERLGLDPYEFGFE